jgi:hypothetical protein
MLPESEKKWNWRGFLVSASVVIGSLVFVVGLQFACLKIAVQTQPTWESRGQFGDTFGFANSLFSGLAYVAIICTIFLQNKQLSVERESVKSIKHANMIDLQTKRFDRNLELLIFLIKHYEEEISSESKSIVSGPVGAMQRARLIKVTEKRDEFQAIIDNLHDEVRAGLKGGAGVR